MGVDHLEHPVVHHSGLMFLLKLQHVCFTLEYLPDLRAIIRIGRVLQFSKIVSSHSSLFHLMKCRYCRLRPPLYAGVTYVRVLSCNATRSVFIWMLKKVISCVALSIFVVEAICHCSMTCLDVAHAGNGFHISKVQVDKVCTPAWGFDMG